MENSVGGVVIAVEDREKLAKEAGAAKDEVIGAVLLASGLNSRRGHLKAPCFDVMLLLS